MFVFEYIYGIVEKQNNKFQFVGGLKCFIGIIVFKTISY